MGEEHSAVGKVFVITGAASGLGAGFAERFLEEGAKHVAIFDISEEAGEVTATRLKTKYGEERVSFTKCDVTDAKLLERAFSEVAEKRGRVGVVINNAGILNDSPNMFRLANEVNWQALTTLSTLAWEHMRADRGGAGGTLVNISSLAALAQWPWLPVYSGAKAAVLHFSVCLGMEPTYSRSGVRVLCMCYGQTETPLMQGVKDKCMDEVMGRHFEMQEQQITYQSVAAAVEAMSSMFARGASASVWLATHGAPVKDITKHIRNAYDAAAGALVE